ncbi:MAG: hypothetical protein J2P31_21665, partial [Blastocatellia bacterium]|nr:hypothetical protein [Blastocatellia bacterium]
MNNLNQKSIMLPIAVALAVALPVAGWWQGSSQQSAAGQQTPGAMARDAPQNAASGPPGPERDGAARLLCDFFGLKTITTDTDRGDYCLLMAGRNPKGYHIEHLIATVPDPLDSHLDYFFDRNLDAMELAIEATGYTIDRFRLPWGRSNSQQPGGLTPYQQRRLYTREPDIILFRNIKPEDHRLLLLFLVGETPTTGIHKEAFSNSLDQLARLHEAGILQPAEEESWNIRVLGPSFSGSATSLALSLKEFFDKRVLSAHAKVQVISGSATAIDKNDMLCLTGNYSRVTFNTTVPLDTDVQ